MASAGADGGGGGAQGRHPACPLRHGRPPPRWIDTEGFYTAVQEKILARYGKVFDWSLKAKMMGKTTAESTRI
ncbi:hypothetical protein ACP70R_003183 [Stipagrostis hirtigluma subsp. patula]